MRTILLAFLFLSPMPVHAQGSNAHLNPIARGVAHPAFNFAPDSNPAGIGYARGLFLNPYVATSMTFSGFNVGARIGAGMRRFAAMAGADINLGLGNSITIPYAIGSILGRGLAIGIGGSLTSMTHNLGLIISPIGKFRVGLLWSGFTFPSSSSLAAGMAFELGRAVSMAIDASSDITFTSITVTPGILIGAPGFSIQVAYSLPVRPTFGFGTFLGGAQILLGDFTLQLMYNTINTFYGGLILKI